MNLHLHPSDFSALIRLSAEYLNINQFFIEKDYWLTLVLKNLAQSEYHSFCVFKGGTSLSKAYGLIQRFSEDVDLALLTQGQSNNQVKKQIDNISKMITAQLEEVSSDPRTSKGSRFRRTAHRFPQHTEVHDVGQVYDKLVVELNAFANPHPYQLQPIHTFIYTYLQSHALESEINIYALTPFQINVLSLERTMAEKIMAVVRAAYATDPLAQLQEKIRHLYDLHQVLQQPDLQAWLASDELFPLLDAVRADDAKNSEFQGAWAQQPLAQAPLFQAGEAFWAGLQRTYEGPFQSLVYGNPPAFAEVRRSLEHIGQRLHAYDCRTES